MGTLTEIFKQLFSKPFTNLFPVPAHPETNLKLSVLEVLDGVGKGEIAPTPPVPIPPGFRGRLTYDREACIGCRQCMRVCPSDTIEFLEGEKKVRFLLARCTFCQMCIDICPKDCIGMDTGIFENLMATTDKYEDALILTDSGPIQPPEPEPEPQPEPEVVVEAEVGPETEEGAEVIESVEPEPEAEG